MRDPHEILGINRAAKEAEIKRAFRAKAKLYHPDLHPNDPVNEREFRDIVAAYHECIKRRKDKDAAIQGAKRSFSEELNRAGATEQPKKPAKKTQPTNTPFPEDNIDIGAHKRPPPNNKTAQKPQQKSTATKKQPEDTGGVGSFFKKTILGGFEQLVQKNLNQQKTQPKASKAKKSAKQNIKNAGIDHHFTLDVGFMEARNGTKKTLKLKDGRQVQVKIAPETREGQTLRLQAMGQAANRNHKAGDALVIINVVDDQYAERSNNDFFLRLPVTLSEAALGTEIRIPGLYQDLILKIPSGSNSGTNLRLKGQGFKDKDNGQAGDQYVTLEVKLPSHIDRRLETFLTEWSKDFDYDVRRNIGMGSIDQTMKKETKA